MEEKIARMRELIPVLQKASRAYYAQDTEIMSNFEYDRLYDELQALEAETGIVLSGSPSVTVRDMAGMDALPKERHESPMLSLAKTKGPGRTGRAGSAIRRDCFPGSWTVLTIVLTYRRTDSCVKAVTTRKRRSRRGHHTERQNVSATCRCRIPYQGRV